MSLFKLKHLWLHPTPHQLSQHHLSITSQPTHPTPTPTLAVGSYSGHLSIYQVNMVQGECKVVVLYQCQFQGPIVAVEWVDSPDGREKLCLGVLLERKFVYLGIRKSPNQNPQTRQITIPIQPSFAIQPKSLSTMTLNSSIQYLNPISKQPLKVSDPIYSFSRKNDHLYYNDGEELVLLQNTTQQWRITVGPIRMIHVLERVDAVGEEEAIVVVGENAVWEVVESRIVKTKVIEQDISCAAIIQLPETSTGKEEKAGPKYNILIADFKNRICIFNEEFVLIWAVKVSEVPVKMLVFRGGIVNGAIAMIGEEGSVSISYLGTQLPQTQIQPLPEQLPLHQIQSQTKKLLSQFTKSTPPTIPKTVSTTTTNSLPRPITMSIRCGTPQCYTLPLQNPQQYFHNNGLPWSCEIVCEIAAKEVTVFEVAVGIVVPANIIVVGGDGQRKIGTIKTTQRLKFTLLCCSQKFPSSPTIQLLLRYLNPTTSTPNLIPHPHPLPLQFQCTLKSLQLEQKPSNKIVLKCTTQLPQLSQIFHEFAPALGHTKNFTIRLANGVLCSVGYNKNNTKVKIEANVFSGLGFMFGVILGRVEAAGRELSIDDIPLEEFFSLMRDHHSLRQQQRQAHTSLQQKTDQFLSTQKLLLQKIKQKSTSINRLDKVLEYTYSSLLSCTSAVQSIHSELQSINHNLQVALNFILGLLFMKSKATEHCKRKVLGIVGYEREGIDEGWEEKVVANAGFFLGKKGAAGVVGAPVVFDQVYKTALWVISKINSGDWNQE